MVALDLQGRVVQEPKRFFGDVAGLDLEDRVSGYAVVGLALDDLPAQSRIRIDRSQLDQSELTLPTDGRSEIASFIYLSRDAQRLEVDLAAKRPYLDIIGPRAFATEDTISSTITFSLTARVPVAARFCRPVVAEDRTPSFSASAESVSWRHPVGLHPFSDGSLISGIDADNVGGLRALLVRIQPSGMLAAEDVLTLPGPTLADAQAESLRQVSLRPGTPHPDHVRVLALKLDGRQPGAVQKTHLHLLELPRTAAWTGVDIDDIGVEGPVAGEAPSAALGAAESHRGDLLVLGGRNDGTGPVPLPHGFVAIRAAGSASTSFSLHHPVFSGSVDGDILYRAVALPPDPERPDRSNFALGSRRGEILIATYDAATDELVERERYVPPPDFTVKVGSGFRDMHVFPRAGGYELWAVGYQSLLVRRTVDGRWQLMTDLIRKAQLPDESALGCSPVGYPRGREVYNVARKGSTALITLEFCTGAMLLRFDEADEPLCVTAALAPGATQLAVDPTADFSAVTAVESGYYMLRKNSLELMHVAVED